MLAEAVGSFSQARQVLLAGSIFGAALTYTKQQNNTQQQ
jgi:hypothetical protein